MSLSHLLHSNPCSQMFRLSNHCTVTRALCFFFFNSQGRCFSESDVEWVKAWATKLKVTVEALEVKAERSLSRHVENTASNTEC